METKHYIQVEDIVEQLKALCYFDIFSYPLTFEEICSFSKEGYASKDKLKIELERLVEKGILFKLDGFYLLRNELGFVTKRKENNQRAKVFIRKAKKISKVIARFPFVRAVFVSGSLSKNSMPEDGDIDYFIVTKPNRLWIARTMLVLFKKVFLFNSHKYFCVNYFVDENHLEIEEQNRFTATEVVTLLPMYGKAYYRQLMEQNQWVKHYYPHFPKRETSAVKTYHKGVLQRLLELPFYGKIGDSLDDFLMDRTFKYWKKKFKNISENRFQIALKSRKHISKHHPSDFQKKVLDAFEKRVKTVRQKVSNHIQELASRAH